MKKDKDPSVSLDDLIIWTSYWKHMQEGNASNSTVDTVVQTDIIMVPSIP